MNKFLMMTALTMILGGSAVAKAEDKPAAQAAPARMVADLLTAIEQTLEEMKLSEGILAATKKLVVQFRGDQVRYYIENQKAIEEAKSQGQAGLEKLQQIMAKAPQVQSLFQAIATEFESDDIAKFQQIMEGKRAELEKKYGQAFSNERINADKAKRAAAARKARAAAEPPKPRLDPKKVYAEMQLTADQWQQIQRIGQEAKEQLERFLSMNADKLKQIAGDLKTAYAAQDLPGIQQASENLQELMKLGPDDVHEKILAILNTAQRKLYAPLAEQQRADMRAGLLKKLGIELPQ